MNEPGRIEFRALGTGCVVMTVDAAAVDDAHDAVTAELAAIDGACSRFRSDSDLERVNNHPGEAIDVSERLLDALDVAFRAALLTDGDLDPTIGNALIVLGYDRDFAALDPDASAGRVRIGRARGWQCITVNRVGRTVSVPPGVRIDLGATAKAWAADRAAEAASAVDCGVLVSLGGDIAVANTAPCDGWPIAIAEHHNAPLSNQSPTVTIRDGGLATSSTTARRWNAGGETVHHILDPNTGLPAASYWRTVSVAASSAVDANIASTTSIIRGPRALEWLSSVGLPARLVRDDSTVTLVNGWPEDAALDRADAAVRA